MPRHSRYLRLVVLLALLIVSLPTALPVHAAQTFTVTLTSDTDDNLVDSCPAATCTLRKAIRLANVSTGNTINFGISGTPPFTINVTQALPVLSGSGTTITVEPAHTVVLSGVGLPFSTFGLSIMSANNTVRGLVIVGFPGSVDTNGGSGILLSGINATGNLIANNWIGLNADGTSAFGNAFHGIQIDEKAHDNMIGGTAATDRNVISGNLVANISVKDSDDSSSGPGFISGNQIIGNYIGTDSTGTQIPTGINQSSLQAGVLVGSYAYTTTIKGNQIGFITDNPALTLGGGAGVVVQSNEFSINPIHPHNTIIVGNDVGVTSSGAAIPNRFGVRISGSAVNTLIGDPADPVGGRNVIGNSTDVGIKLSDDAYNIVGTQIVGNYIGVARDGVTLAPIGTIGSTVGAAPDNIGIYLGSVGASGSTPATIIGPANVIAASRRFGIRVRSGGNTIKGNFIGTNPTGTVTGLTSPTAATPIGFGTGGTGIWVENGNGNKIGGPNGADRNVIAVGGSGGSVAIAAIAIRPDVTSGGLNTCSPATCSVTSTTIQGNYLGVKATGDAALASITSSEGLRISGTNGNTVSGNLISGVDYGITLRNIANTNIIDLNKIGTGASGSLVTGIGNKLNGIYILQGTGNQINNNLIAFNGTSSSSLTQYHGISIDNTTAGANNNVVNGNRLVANGISSVGSPGGGSGIFVRGATGIKITQSATSGNKLDGITLSLGGNIGLASPTLAAVTNAVPPVLTGDATACGSGCTVEVFTSPVSDDKEGPIYLTTGTTTTGGAFSINVPGCQRYLTATVRDASDNTSSFSTQFDALASTACAPPNFTLGAATPNSTSTILGSTAIYTHTITNNDAIARTYTVVITSSLGWASAPPSVTVPANSSASFQIVVTVPLTAKTSPVADVDTTSVQVFVGSIGSANVQTDTTTAKLISLNPAAPAVSPGQTKARAGTTVTFTHNVTNTGNLLGTFSVVGPTFVGTPPTGWTIGTATLAQPSLAGGASTTLVITVNTPAGAPALPVQISFRILASTGAQTADIVDTITMSQVRSFTFSALAPTTVSGPPGASVNFIYTLTNTGNASDTFLVAPPPNAVPLTFSITPSSNITLGIGASRTITLTAQVSQSAVKADYLFSVTASAVGGSAAPANQNASGTVSVIGGGAPLLTFSASTPRSVDAAGGTLDFTGILTNTGNQQAIPFILGTPSVTGSPAGWSAVVVRNGTCPASISLNINQSCTFTLRVTVPVGAGGGTQAVTMSATADNGVAGTSPEDVTTSATATATVTSMRGVSLGAARISPTQTGLPTVVLTFTHTLTNTGNATDSFSISVSPTPPAIVSMAVLTPTSLLNVPPLSTRTITLTVTVPQSILAGTNLPFVVTATSLGDPNKQSLQTDTAIVGVLETVLISAGTSQNGKPNNDLIFTHTLTNTGNTAIAYDITASNSDAGFSQTQQVTGSPTAKLNPGQTATITVTIHLPTGVPGGTSNSTTLQVTKLGTSAPILASATDISRIGDSYGVLITPDRIGVGYPNATLVFTHTVTNVGISVDTYTVTATNSISWGEGVTPDQFTLAPGASQVISVMIDVPNDNNTPAGTINQGLVRVVSNINPKVSYGQVHEQISVGQTAAVNFTPDQAQAVTPSSGTLRMRDLVLKNNGNGSDTFDFVILGADNGWSVEILSFDPLNPRETDYNVAVKVTVPSNVEPGPTKTITIQARSRSDSTVIGEVRLRFVYIAPAMKATYRSFLPLVVQ
ncbi:MAG: hypothetical protein WCK70_07670 [Chloroflexales bacterium]